MSKAHADFMRTHLLSVIRKVSKTDGAHPNRAVLESASNRITLASQAIAMIDCMEVDPVRFAAALRMPLPMHWSLMTEPERDAWARCYIDAVTPKRKEADDVVA
jgi:hypothetical protein